MAATANTAGHRPRVVVVGAGFGGLNAARGLGKLPVDVTVIDRKNHHTFQPLLYQVAMAMLSPADIAQPIRSILREHRNIEVLMDEVTGIDTAARRVQTKSGATAVYDYLVLASGSMTSYFGHDDWAALAPGLKTLEDATEIRRRVLLAFELAERQQVETGNHPPLQFVIIGGGPTGVELAGAISDIARLYMTKDFRHIDPREARVLILEGSPRILGTYPEELQQKAIEQLDKLGVRHRTGSHVTDIGPGYVMIGDERIESVCTLWAAGVRPSPLGKMLGVPTDKRGNVLIDQHLNPEGHPEIFVIGDLAYFKTPGKEQAIPWVAQPAMQMGTYAAKRIGLLLEDPAKAAAQKPFVYFDKGDMATIGRSAAVARIVWPFHANWSGFMAWVTWLVVHIFFLVGLRNRLSVFRNWAWTYLRLEDGVRLIEGQQDLPGWGSPATHPNADTSKVAPVGQPAPQAEAAPALS